MNAKDKAFLKNFLAKESSNLIGFENFVAVGFHYGQVGVVLPYQSKRDQISTHQSPHPLNFYILSMKVLLSSTVT